MKPSPSNQELTRSPWTPITAEPAFSSLYGSPSRAIKHFPTLSDSTDSPADSLYPADSLCFADPPRFLAYPPPGVLPESDRPIKGPDQRSIGVAPSSRGVSYIWGYWEEGGHTNQNPHQSFQITWMLRNGLTHEVLNLTTGIHPPNTWWPDLYFNLKDLIQTTWSATQTRNFGFWACPGHLKTHNWEICGGAATLFL